MRSGSLRTRRSKVQWESQKVSPLVLFLETAASTREASVRLSVVRPDERQLSEEVDGECGIVTFWQAQSRGESEADVGYGERALARAAADAGCGRRLAEQLSWRPSYAVGQRPETTIIEFMESPDS